MRHPFLDECVISFLSSLSLNEICDFENTLINKNYLGDKKILRVMAGIYFINVILFVCKFFILKFSRKNPWFDV